MGISTTDFLARKVGTDAPASGPGGCFEAVQSSGSSIDETVKRIRSAISDNLTCVAICGFIALVTAAVLWYVGSTLAIAVSEWRLHKQPKNGGPPKGVTTAATVDPDDVVYSMPSSGSAGSLLPPPDETAAVRSRMAKVAAKYSQYNQAISRYAANRGEAADDLIDGRILSRSDDDYSYGKGYGKGDLRFRKNQGNQQDYGQQQKPQFTPSYS